MKAKYNHLVKGVMTGVISLAAFSCVKTTTECSNEVSAVPCIDMSGVDTTAACITVYEPVCGCDGNTYSNSCVAAQNGVQAWVDGECCD